MRPFLFYIGEFPLATYGPMIVLGMAAGIFLAIRLGRREGIGPEPIYDLAFIAVLAGFLGARLLLIVLNFSEFLADPLSMIFSRTGFVFAGGFVAAVLTAIVYIRRHALPLWSIGDIAAPSLALAHGFGRIGCFLAGCCYGGLCPPGGAFSFLGLSFPKFTDSVGNVVFSNVFHDHVVQGRITSSASSSLAVWPTQLLEAVSNFIICGVLLLLWKRRQFTGQLFCLYLLLYGSARFSVEFLRGDVERGLYFGGQLSTSQIFSLGAIAAGITLWTVLRRPQREVVRGARAAHGK